MEYNCTDCNYATNDKSNFQKHLRSIKHIKKSDELKNNSKSIHKLIINWSDDIPEEDTNVYECPFCKNTYSSSSNLTRHKKSCSKKEQLETKYNNELEKKEREIQRLTELYEKDTTHLKELHEKDNQKNQEVKQQQKDEIKHLKTLINKSRIK